MSSLRKILINKDSSCQSIWFMRQAGRYLPEFRKIRSQNKNFINLCLDSELSSKITLQPIKRFNLDSAIIFSDILMVPYALGQDVKFKKNEGPILSKFSINRFLDNNEINFTKKLNPIYEAIKETRKKLNKEKSLISFIGAPWTLLVYMLGLKENKQKINFTKIKEKKIDTVLVLKQLTNYLCLHIKNQIEAGADVIQIFDSWAGFLPNKDLDNYCYNPNLELVNFCKEKKIPVICFPRGLKERYLEFQDVVKPDGMSLDYEIDPLWAKKKLTKTVLQGGMNPKILLESEKNIFNETKKYLDIFKDVPYIFNLGHGIVPETNPDKVEKLIQYVRKYK